jgi:hypothetical protein
LPERCTLVATSALLKPSAYSFEGAEVLKPGIDFQSIDGVAGLIYSGGRTLPRVLDVNQIRSGPARTQKKEDAERLILQECETIRANRSGKWTPASYIVKKPYC